MTQQPENITATISPEAVVYAMRHLIDAMEPNDLCRQIRARAGSPVHQWRGFEGTPSPAEILSTASNGNRNLMTPEVVRVDWLVDGFLVAEVAVGEFLGESVAGLTVVEVDGPGGRCRLRSDLSIGGTIPVAHLHAAVDAMRETFTGRAVR